MISYKKAIVGQCTTIIYSNFFLLLLSFKIIITIHCSFSNSTTSNSDLNTTTNAARSNVWVYKTEKADFWEEMGLSSKLQIEPLLSRKIERPMNLHIDMMKYEFSKPIVTPVSPIKTESENAEEVKTYFVRDKEVAAEHGQNYDPPCSQLIYKAEIWNAKAWILERQSKSLITLW